MGVEIAACDYRVYEPFTFINSVATAIAMNLREVIFFYH